MTTTTIARPVGGRTIPLPRTPFKRLLVPLDGSELAEHAVPFARRLARLLEADLLLVRATEAHARPGGRAAAQIKAVAEAEPYLERIGNRYRPDYSVEYLVPYGDPAAEIANVAEQ